MHSIYIDKFLHIKLSDVSVGSDYLTKATGIDWLAKRNISGGNVSLRSRCFKVILYIALKKTFYVVMPYMI
jgi:hypothetical protein